MSVLSVLSGLSTAAGKGYEGYGQDQQIKVRNALALRNQEEEERRNRVLETVAGRPVAPPRDPVADHATNRAFDIANPLPTTAAVPAPHFDSGRGGFVAPGKPFEPVVGLPPLNTGPSEAQQAQTAARTGAREDRLQQNFQDDPAVKQAGTIANAVAQLRASAAHKTPQGDLNMIYGIVKLRDPNSAVREGEIDLQRAARSVGTQITAAWQKAKAGRTLTDAERDEIMQLVDETVTQQTKLVEPVQKRFGARAHAIGADSSYVAPDPFTGVRQSSAKAAPPTQGEYDAARLIHSDADLAKHYDLTGIKRKP